MTNQNRCIKITPDGHIVEVSRQQEEEETIDRMYSGYALSRPEHWDHERKFRLTMTMVDLFQEGDDLNIVVTALARRLRCKDHETDDAILGTVYIANETVDKISNFTMDDYIYIRDRVFN